MIEDRPERIDVTRWANRVVFARGLFRRYVARRTEHLARDSQSGIAMHLFGETKVCDMRNIKQVDQHIGRSEIAMQDITAMRVMNGFGDCLQQRGGALTG